MIAKAITSLHGEMLLSAKLNVDQDAKQRRKLLKAVRPGATDPQHILESQPPPYLLTLGGMKKSTTME
jgi:hypothetical protein